MVVLRATYLLDLAMEIKGMNERFWVVLLPGPGVYFEGLHKKFWAKQASKCKAQAKLYL